MSPLEIMALPFAECLVLVGIHSYLGLHVIKRRVIFVDLALAQIAALGATVAFLFGIHPHSPGSYVFSLVFTLFGAAVFSLTRTKEERIPQEAIIGLVYALAAAVAILVIARAPHGAEHIKEILTGSILWVRGRTVLTAAIVYSAVGVFHFIFRDKFLAISENADAARAAGLNVALWDFLFYASFGIVITHSVETAGVLLVFVFLVVPAIIAILLTDRLLYQLLIGWGLGTLVSVVGLAISYFADLSTGPAVVSFYGLVLLVMALGIYIAKAQNRMRALRNVVVGTVVVVAFFGTLSVVGEAMGKSEYWAIPYYMKEEHAKEHAHSAHKSHPANKVNELLNKLASLDFEQKQQTLRKVSDVQTLRKALKKANDTELKLALAKRLAKLGNNAGFTALVELLSEADVPPLLRSDALDAIKEHAKTDFGYNPLDNPATPQNKSALENMRKWLNTLQKNK